MVVKRLAAAKRGGKQALCTRGYPICHFAAQ
jgi:hypothetical protein